MPRPEKTSGAVSKPGKGASRSGSSTQSSTSTRTGNHVQKLCRFGWLRLTVPRLRRCLVAERKRGESSNLSLPPQDLGAHDLPALDDLEPDSDVEDGPDNLE